MVLKFSEPQTPQLQNEEKTTSQSLSVDALEPRVVGTISFCAIYPSLFLQLLGNRIIFAGIPWTNILMESWIM